MFHIFISSILLSVIHALIPNHWMPLIFISRSEKWEVRETIFISMITAVAHTLSTIVIGIGVGVLGYKLAVKYEYITTLVAPLVLIAIGLFYFIKDVIHHHAHDHFSSVMKLAGNKKAIITSMLVAMFFSPCLEIEGYYFTAGLQGWPGIITVSMVYLFITVAGIMLLTYAGIKSMAKFDFEFLEKHEKKITGLVLIAIGVFNFLLPGHHV